MDFNPLTNDDVADILALLDSLPYDELDLETPRFRLTLRRTPYGWTQSTQVPPAAEPLAASEPLAAPEGAASGVRGPLPPSIGGGGPRIPVDGDGNGGGGPRTPVDRDGDGNRAGAGEGDEAEGELVAVRAPLPGTFYRAPRPGAAPFVEVGSRVGADTAIGIVE